MSPMTTMGPTQHLQLAKFFAQSPPPSTNMAATWSRSKKMLSSACLRSQKCLRVVFWMPLLIALFWCSRASVMRIWGDFVCAGAWP
jgi:hypothetical protein